MTDFRWRFLGEVFLSNTRRDAFVNRSGRSVYGKTATAEQHDNVVEVLNAELVSLAAGYVQPVDEEAHIHNIAALSARLSTTCGPALNEGILAFGVAQKALNSYLKYLWCAGRIVMPPHCPFDAVIIGEISSHLDATVRAVGWTSAITDLPYRAWVAAAKIVASGEPLAEWELRVWSAKQRQLRTKARA